MDLILDIKNQMLAMQMLVIKAGPQNIIYSADPITFQEKLINHNNYELSYSIYTELYLLKNTIVQIERISDGTLSNGPI